MKKLLIALLLLALVPFAPKITHAQCTGIFQNNTYCGNQSGGPAPPTQNSLIGTFVIGPTVSTSGQVPTWGNSTGTQLADPSTITTSQIFSFSQGLSANTVTTSTLSVTSQFFFDGSLITVVGTVVTSGSVVLGHVPFFFDANHIGDTGILSSAIATLTTSNQVVNGGGATIISFNNSTITSGSIFTPNCGSGPLQFATNNGPFTLQKMSKDSACDILLTNSVSAGTVTTSGFTTVTPGTFGTVNTSQFILHLEEINGVATYTVTNIK